MPEKKDSDLGINRYINGLVKFIESSSAPITIALQGEWGSGKTSLMNNLHDKLCGKEKSFVGVTVNTWEYSMLSSPEMTVVRILEHIIDCIAKDNHDLRDKARKILSGLGNFALGFGREALKISVGDTGAKIIEGFGVRTKFSESDTPPIFSISDLRKEISKAIDHLIKPKNENDKSYSRKKGVIVFVDDLDRLNPPLAVEILELLKNVFTLENCIFVLAIDYDVIVKGLKPKFGEMTEKNEREFRSFFDKIIQVPFSLPVSSYQPDDFVMKSLVKIQFVNPSEMEDPVLMNPIHEIVEHSVGKNPRSIKRLINTLSLLSCIAADGKDSDEEFSKSREGRISTFAVVSIQISYPKVYRMLSESPNFTSWNKAIASKFNIDIESDEEDVDWRMVLEGACKQDPFLSRRLNDIIFLLEKIEGCIDKSLGGLDGDKAEFFERRIRSIIDKSSITNVSDSSSLPTVDVNRLLHTLQSKVSSYIKDVRNDIPMIKQRPITDKGGLFVYFPDGKRFNVAFRPVVRPEKIALEIELETKVRRPDRVIGSDWETLYSEVIVKNALDNFDSFLIPLLRDKYFFEGRTYPETEIKIFPSFTEEQAYRCNKGWQNDHLSVMVSYWINFKSTFQFEDDKVIEIIAQLIIHAYDYHMALMNWK